MKAVLVIDMPKACWRGCPCEYDTISCQALDRNLDYPTADKCRPDWCELRPLPEKMDTHTTSELDNLYNSGWNACLKAITGGKE